MNTRTRKLVYTALFAALTALADQALRRKKRRAAA